MQAFPLLYTNVRSAVLGEEQVRPQEASAAAGAFALPAPCASRRRGRTALAPNRPVVPPFRGAKGSRQT